MSLSEASATTPATGSVIPTSLDPLRFPLHGSRLIEASAGTGKTFTIAALYVRLVLGHGEPSAQRRAFTPPEILVVTFSDAATHQLRDRIRTRLAEAARYFRADPDSVEPRPRGEDLLHDLRAAYPPAYWPRCAGKLQNAAEWMDEAAVSTIHAWCQRMLREHAFDSGSLFTQTLETDQSRLLAEVVRDYWRTFMVPLDAAAVAEVRVWWTSPERLQGDLRGLVDHADRLGTAAEPAVSVRTVREERERRLAELKAPWRTWVDELQILLDEAVASNSVNRRRLQPRHYDPWLGKIRTWATDPKAVPLDLKAGWTRLTPEGLAEVWTEGEPPLHPGLNAIAALQIGLSNLPNARVAVLQHAARWVGERFAAEQARRAQMGFNDLLTRLEAALKGPNGERLAGIIRHQFPVALIDEFQDTDPVQYGIFDAVYRVAANDLATALVLIGDPKQAIYAFRGADVYTYLAARRACAGRLYTLRNNYRSTQAMVAASNRCFVAAEARASGAGAFLFRTETDNPVPFMPAEARGRGDALHASGEPLPALTVWWLAPSEGGKGSNKVRDRDRIAASCASEVVRLLNLGQAKEAGFVPDGDPNALRPLRPADLAVLVNSRTEANLIRRALAQRRVRSVYLSDQDSVFQSPQATELRHWLAACAEPDDNRLLRAALATPTLGLSWAELDALNQDELALEARVLQFRDYRDCWRRQGVLPMLRRLLNDFRVQARLLGQGEDGETGWASASGERILTDLLHLAELLQRASVLLDGEHALIRHLAEQCRDASRGARRDERQIRLESDADLVQVVTVHKSKGLEYPLVFLPFAAAYRPTRADELPLKWHDEDGRLQLALTDDGEIVKRADRERLGEDLRKLYVALTRARYATWVGLAPLADVAGGAFGYLLGGGEPLEGDLVSALEALRGDCEDIAVVPAPEAMPTPFRTSRAAALLGPARESRPVGRDPWWIASYSALKTIGSSDPPQITMPVETPTQDRFHEMLATRTALSAAELSTGTRSRADMARGRPLAADSLHGFPRGAEAGTFLHDLLEWAAIRGFAEVAADPGLLRDAIVRRCKGRSWAHWTEPLTAWLRRLLVTPLQLPALGDGPATAFPLAGLASAVPEMEFWVAADRVDTCELDRLVRAHTLEGDPRPELQPAQLTGMLKGYMDLVFEHEGRYYVADYKSNWLGPDADAYTAPAMRAEILRARYELQYALYLFALHRLLKSRLPGYDYDRHVGGAVYLFLRGIDAPSQGLHVERPPRELIEALDRCFARSADRARR